MPPLGPISPGVVLPLPVPDIDRTGMDLVSASGLPFLACSV
ncbi:MAG: hypothetical protein QOJ19_3892, partial [Acidimicrobiia bacterium]|nr:hypothetical protein [Acidimicrobiia bacterium]